MKTEVDGQRKTQIIKLTNGRIVDKYYQLSKMVVETKNSERKQRNRTTIFFDTKENFD